METQEQKPISNGFEIPAITNITEFNSAFEQAHHFHAMYLIMREPNISESTKDRFRVLRDRMERLTDSGYEESNYQLGLQLADTLHYNLGILSSGSVELVQRKEMYFALSDEYQHPNFPDNLFEEKTN